jgi:transposase
MAVVSFYDSHMRYPDGGGLSARARADREYVRFQAAEMFADGLAPPEVARRLRVTRASTCAWHRAWTAGGKSALVSKGPGGSKCRLDSGQVAALEAALDAGPAAHGWDEDQRWTLARVASLITDMFRVHYTVRGVSYLLHRIGWTPQVPIHRATERDEEKIATWVKETWPDIKGPRGAAARGSVSRTRPGRV